MATIRLPWEPPAKSKPLFPKLSGVTVPKGCPLKQQWLENCIADAKDLNIPLGRVEQIPGARIKGEFIGTICGVPVDAVDANAVNLAYDKELTAAGDKNNWVDGGNSQKWTFQPDRIWINRVLAADPTERVHVAVHECSERLQMKDHKLKYPEAHENSNLIEVQMMKLLDPCPCCGQKKDKCTCGKA